MSILSLPRIILNGTTSWNPATNNNSLSDGYNKDPVTVKLPAGVTYESFDQWLTQFNPETGQTNGSWNVFGQMQSDFNADIVGTKSGSPDAEDPLVGGILQFQGGTPKLVDVNAYSSVSSQVFIGKFGVEGPGKLGIDLGFSGQASCRMTSRRPFMKRNMGGLAIAGNMGVVWQTTIAKDDIQWAKDNAQSSILTELRAAMEREDVQGVMLRFASYTTIYFSHIIEGGLTTPGNGTPEMTAAYKMLADRWASLHPIAVGNIAQAFNPAVSSLTGAIGLWEANELATVPTERVLAMTGVGSLGPAQAKIDEPRGIVALDLQNTFPELGAASEKAPLGSVMVVSRADNGLTTPIATLTPDEYDKTAYEAGGGILDVPYKGGDWDTIRAGRLEFMAINGPGKMGGMSPQAEISQLRLYADTDDRSVYLNETDSHSVSLRVYENGALPLRAAKVLISAYYPPQEGPAEGLWQLVPTDSASTTPPRNVSLTGGIVTSDGVILDVAADGAASFMVSAVAPGNAFLTFLPFFAEDTPPAAPSALAISNIATTGYCAVRVMPFDDALGNIPEDQVSWNFVYENVLRPFDLVYRGMSAGVFSLGDEASIRAHAGSIIGFTDLNEFDSPLYMPVTRDLSRGRRTLLVRYLKPGEDEAVS